MLCIDWLRHRLLLISEPTFVARVTIALYQIEPMHKAGRDIKPTPRGWNKR